MYHLFHFINTHPNPHKHYYEYDEEQSPWISYFVLQIKIKPELSV